MLQLKKYFQIIAIILVIIVSACDKKEEKIDDSVNEIIKLIQTDADSYKEDITNITNSVDLVEQEEEIRLDDEMETISVITDSSFIPEDTSNKESRMIVDIPRQIDSSKYKDLLYIKIGNDKSYNVVSRRNPQKITVAITLEQKYSNIDIFIYAIPIKSKLIRNSRTLIGYVKNLEIINNQVQFTRYWLGRRSSGSSLRKGYYNIYVQYYYKNSNNRIIKLEGRYWGGNHRNWKIKVI